MLPACSIWGLSCGWLLVHMEVCFLTVSKISTGDGMRGFGCREAEGLPVSCCMCVRVRGYG